MIVYIMEIIFHITGMIVYIMGIIVHITGIIVHILELLFTFWIIVHIMGVKTCKKAAFFLL